MPSNTVHVALDHRIRMRVNDVPDELDDALIEALCIPNLEKENALKQHVWGAEDMDDEIPMYGLTGPRSDAVLDMPRGFMHDLRTGLASMGLELEIEDDTARPLLFRAGKKILPRDHQPAAIEAILHSKVGIYKAPPGSGKTVVVLQAGKRAGTKCCIVVNTKDVMNQWVKRIHEHLGEHIEVGTIGDNKFSIGPYWTVAIQATLHSRFDKLEADGFFDSFGFMCLDESHHATAETYLRVIDRFSSQWRFGVSATPDKTGDFALAQLVLGPLIHITSHDGLVEAGHLIKPTIIRVKTDFGYNFKGTTSRWSRSNYPDMLKALLIDPIRNASIVGAILHEAGHHCLVLTKRHEHIDLLEAMVEESGYDYPIARLTGKESTEERNRVIKMLNEEPCLVFSTIADEAIDVPRMDRGFLTFPQSNIGLIEQQSGRFERTHPDKKDSKIYDWADVKVTAFKNQWSKRLFKVYKKRGFKIVHMHVSDFVDGMYYNKEED